MNVFIVVFSEEEQYEGGYESNEGVFSTYKAALDRAKEIMRNADRKWEPSPSGCNCLYSGNLCKVAFKEVTRWTYHEGRLYGSLTIEGHGVQG